MKLRCRMVFVEYGHKAGAAGEYHPMHVANPASCARGDMTEQAQP